jgi:hypothetical protein
MSKLKNLLDNIDINLIKKFFIVIVLFRYVPYSSSFFLLGLHKELSSLELILVHISLFYLIFITFRIFKCNENIIHLILLNICTVYLDHMFMSETLGTTVLAMCTLSFHRGRSSNGQIFKMAAFYAYAVSSFSAFYFHISDESWLKGETLKILFSSSYLCRFNEVFLFFDNSYPKTFLIFSQVGVFLHSAFQILLPFAFFNKYIFKFIFFWGWIFFISCFIFIELTYLPILEIVLWISLFHSNDKLQHPKVLSSVFFKFSTLYFFIALSHGYYNTYYRSIFLYKFYKIIGIEAPNVFNKYDLNLSNCWTVVEKKKISDTLSPDLSSKDKFIHVPITKIDGSKDYYQYNDLLYQNKFGTCAYRRNLISFDSEDEILNFHDKKGSYAMSCHKFYSMFDYKHSFCNEPFLYKFKLYYKSKHIADRFLVINDGKFINSKTTYYQNLKDYVR